jgi:hypothetical protein
MLDNLVNLIKQNAGDEIINNPAIPNDRNEEAVKETSDSIIGTLKNSLSGGNFNEVIKMFSQGQADNNSPVVQQAAGDLTGRLQNKFGLGQQQASGLAGGLVTKILNQFAGKTADPNDNGFNAQDIFNQLSGGKTSGMNIPSLLSKFKGGLDKDGDGDVDMQDLKSLFAGGGGAGVIMDKVKGMFN